MASNWPPHPKSCTHTHTHTRTHTQTQTHTLVHIDTHTHSLQLCRASRPPHQRSCTHTHAHTHTHTHMYTHRHTHSVFNRADNLDCLVKDLANIHTLSLSLTHTHTHNRTNTHSLFHTHTQHTHRPPHQRSRNASRLRPLSYKSVPAALSSCRGHRVFAGFFFCIFFWHLWSWGWAFVMETVPLDSFCSNGLK